MTDPTAQHLAEGLRQLAAFVEANPDMADDLRYPLTSINQPWNDYLGDAKDYLARYARAGIRAGAKVTKNYDGGKYASVDLHFGPIRMHVYADRERVCERVVVGTREVTEEVPDPEALAAVPKVTVTKTVDEVRWECRPLLAEVVAS